MRTEPTDIAIIIPVLDERENLECLLPQLKEMIGGLKLSAEIIVVDGGSVDGSQEVAARHGTRVITEHKKGFGGALMAGFAAARSPYIVTMDADLSHQPAFLESFWRERETAELLIASRFVKGGRADMSMYRLLLSRVLNRVYARLLSLPLRDMSSGFRMYRSGILDWQAVRAHNFDVQPETLVRIHARGFRVREVPFHYRPRNSGKSHAKLIRFGWSFSKTLFRMWRLRRRSAAAAQYLPGVE